MPPFSILCRDFNQIVLDLKQVLSGSPLAEAPRVSEWLAAELASSAAVQAGIDWANLQKYGFQVYAEKLQPAKLRAALRVENFLPFAAAAEIPSGERFTMIPYAWHVLDNQTANCRHLAEYRHDNPLWIHPARAARLGLKEGDPVQVETENGAIETRAWLTEAIHPSCVAMALGLGHTEMGKVAKAEKIANSDPMTRSLLLHNPVHFTPFSFRLRSWDKVEPVWWHEKGNGVDVRRIFKAEPDRQIAGMTSVDTTVRLRKL